MFRSRRTTFIATLGLVTAGCEGLITQPSSAPGSTIEGSSGAAPLVWLPARVRRLSNSELDNSVAELLRTETTTPLSTQLTPDVRQSGFTANAEQRVDATFGEQLWNAGDVLARQAVAQQLGALVACNGSVSPRTCAATFVDSFASKAYRRPLATEERNGLLTVFDTAMGPLDAGYSGTFSEGVAAVIQAVLQSAPFLYVTELGQGGGPLVELDPYEAAAQLSYLVTGALPDSALLEAAAHDTLRTAEQREAHARRLLDNDSRAKRQLARLVKEWLGIDQLRHIDRTSTVKDSFASLVPSFERETDAFVTEVVRVSDGSLSMLLTADFTMADPKLAAFYGVTPGVGSNFGRVDLSGTVRRGILSQGNFLSTYASTSPPGSSPVLRGKALLHQLLCMTIELPSNPDLLQQAQMAPPPSTTTRQRFEQHSRDPACQGCHRMLDPLGFGFENFDQMGQFRASENGVTIDASGTLVNTDVDGPFADTKALVGKLGSSERVRRCFATNFFRFASAQTSPDAEAQFFDVWSAMPADSRGQLVKLVIEYVRSDMFLKRRTL